MAKTAITPKATYTPVSNRAGSRSPKKGKHQRFNVADAYLTKSLFSFNDEHIAWRGAVHVFGYRTDQHPLDCVQPSGANDDQIVVVVMWKVSGDNRLGIAKTNVDVNIGQSCTFSFFFQIL